MPTALSSVGFPVHTQEQFESLASKLMPEAIAVTSPAGNYLHWRGANGTELWLQMDPDGHVLSLTPHFSSGETIELKLTERLVRPGSTELDGAFFGWAHGDPSTDADDVPFVFDAPDFRAHDELELPTDARVQLTAFTTELQIYASPQAYADFQQDEPRLKSKDILPIGLFSPEGEKIDPPESRIIMTGHVKQTRLLTNPITQAEFHWVRADTLGGEMDVVIHPEFVIDDLAVGGVISGSFTLIGRVSPA